jgi:hypothetical protein
MAQNDKRDYGRYFNQYFSWVRRDTDRCAVKGPAPERNNNNKDERKNQKSQIFENLIFFCFLLNFKFMDWKENGKNSNTSTLYKNKKSS